MLIDTVVDNKSGRIGVAPLYRDWGLVLKILSNTLLE